MNLEEEYQSDIKKQRILIARLQKCSIEEYPLLKIEFNLQAIRLEEKWIAYESIRNKNK